METKKILKILSINEYKLIGTGGDDKIIYKSDIDAQEKVNLSSRDEDTYNYILKFFQNIFNENYKNKNVFITDFKCGIQAGNIPIRWNIKDINNGYKIIEDRKIEFITTLQQQSIIKIDIILLDTDKLYHDISYNYYFLFKNFSTNPRVNTFAEIKAGLLNDSIELKAENKNFKAMKRLYSYYKLNGENEKQLILLAIFNSRVGKFNSLINQLQIIVDVLTNNFRKPNIEDIIYNLKYVEDNIPDEFKHYFKFFKNKNINKKFISNLEYLIIKLNNELNIILNNIGLKKI
jgi:hypothetical protein